MNTDDPHPSRTLTRLKSLQTTLSHIAHTHSGSSYFVFDEAALSHAADLFEHYLPGVTPFYAVKSNDRHEILSHLAARGWSFDVASAYEVERVHALGVSGTRMILANPFKDNNSLESLMRYQVAMTTADSPEELVKLQRTFGGLPAIAQPAVLIRISLPAEGVQTDLGVKFGCRPEQAVPLLQQCVELGLNPGGIAFHVGTQSWNLGNYERAMQAAIEALNTFNASSGLNLRLIDIGGGFPWGTSDGSGPLRVEELLAGVGQICQSAQAQGFMLQAEPGRVICGGAFSLITTVIGKATRNGQTWYYLSDGVYGGYNGVMYDHQPYLFLPLNQDLEHSDQSSDWAMTVVCGPTCDGVDIMSRAAWLPTNLEAGDRVFTPDIGAYSLVAATEFNGFARSPIISGDHAPLPLLEAALHIPVTNAEEIPQAMSLS